LSQWMISKVNSEPSKRLLSTKSSSKISSVTLMSFVILSST